MLFFRVPWNHINTMVHFNAMKECLILSLYHGATAIVSFKKCTVLLNAIHGTPKPYHIALPGYLHLEYHCICQKMSLPWYYLKNNNIVHDILSSKTC